MKNFFRKLILPFLIFFLLATSVHAVTIFTVPQGGIGVGTLASGECLKGNGTGAITSAPCALGTVTSVSGTTNRITSTGGTTPVIDISASYVGQSSITTLGTVTTGVWNGTAIANANLANSSITINGTPIALGASGTITAAASSIIVGTTAVTSGNNTRILFNNSGVLGEYTLTGTGTVVAMQTSPRFITDIAPTTNDNATLGTNLLNFSDLYLASGGVINWNNGNVGITHNNAGTFILVNPGDLRVTTANVGTNTDSVPTLGSTSTLTNKTLTSPTIAKIANLTANGLVQTSGGDGTLSINTNVAIGSIGITIDGGGATITTGSKGQITVPFGCTLNNYYLTNKTNGGESGSIVVDVKRSGTSIVGGGGNKPTISSSTSSNAAISGWTSNAVSAGDILEFNVDSITTFTWINLVLKCTKT